MEKFLKSIQEIVSTISLGKVVCVLVLAIVLIIICKCLAKMTERLLAKSRLGSSFGTFIATILKYVLYFVAVLIVCDYLGLPVTSLLAVFSLLGLAVSLSVQSLLSNLMSGLTVHTLKPFSVGDYIETDIAGTVQDIGLFYTELLTPDNKKVYIPNEKIIANKLINYNGESTRRIDLVFNAGYEYDTNVVIQALKEAIECVELVNKTPECVVGISEYGDSSIKYSVWAWTDAQNFIAARFAIMESVSELYKKYGICMAYNRLEVEMINKDK